MSNPILERVREDDLKYDPWGTSMSWHYAICDAMVEWAPPYPLPEWKFRQGMGGADTGNYAYEEITAMLDRGEITPDDLLTAGKVLHRYEAMLDRQGRSY